MSDLKIHKVLTCFIAIVWIINGLFCKVFNLVPRHELIVARIIGSSHSRLFTLLIGLSEIGMAIWILSGLKVRINALFQILIVAAMNVLEFFLAPELLLWGKFNSLFALVFIVVIYYNEFHFNRQTIQQQ